MPTAGFAYAPQQAIAIKIPKKGEDEAPQAN